MKQILGKISIPPSQSCSSIKSLIGTVLIVVALPILYMGISQTGVLGNALVALSIMALVAALGIGYSFFLKPNREDRFAPKPELDCVLEPFCRSPYEILSLSTDVESLAVFDRDYLLDTMDGDHDMVAILLEVFIDEHLDDGHKIVQALQAGDMEQVQMLSHSLKGVSASLGIEQIHALAEQVEHDVKMQADSEKLENVCELLKMVFTPAALEIQAFLDEYAEIKSRRENSQETSTHEVSGRDKSNIASAQVDTVIASYALSTPTTSIQVENRDNRAEPDCWLDIHALREAMDGDEEAVCMLLEIFIEDNLGTGQELVAAASEPGQQEYALNIVHALKGVAANLNAAVLRKCCGMAEKKLKLNESVSIEECREIEWVLNQTIANAEAYLAEATTSA
ncbi:Hpt domain-containing protein [Photobacterium lutimaris]|uniref:HPt domain-containing protein n=1 Tax=Photobacterium lutimaris TaxID=388278 RepID=A0A2T3IVG4_9GAMM|nr:Hpt domain-containing protein [Photobacterium lutimaris]PSU32390.1 hypothetical protein C9I99_17465 [Photobacterium lutimaris]TDR77589.1 HPt (histidine-containing phosphotransfer) domain-containing protein [Photobacterium lutimaris]